MSKGSLNHVMAWPDSKMMVGFFCSTSIFCLLLLIVLHLTSDGNVIPCGDCSLEHIRQVVENLTLNSPLQREEKPPTESQQVVKVVEEWRLPAITNDRPNEKLDDPETYEEARRFKPMGSGAFLFVQFGAYRGGPNTFAVVGLGTKGLHRHGNPGFECSWTSTRDNSTVQGNASKYYPDYGYGRQYSVVVVNCTFENDVGVDSTGGRLEVMANHGSWDHTGLPDVHFVALTEEPNKYNGSIFGPPYKYDYLYCGSPIYGSISPQRIREWIAYHVRLFGPRSHFILYDAGGIQGDVRKILQPWIKLGLISVANIRQEARYDVYYFSQFLINNDCLFQAKTLANWTFFFDVDEYLHVPDYLQFDKLMSAHYQTGRRAQQVLIKQRFMNHDHCRRNESLSNEDLQRRWGFEKLVYRRTEYTTDFGFTNRKFAIQAQYALATGVHRASHVLLPEGANYLDTVMYEDWRMTYYHYHKSINHREELCQFFVDPALNETKIDNATHVLDYGIAVLADRVREFENRTVGQQPFLP